MQTIFHVVDGICHVVGPIHDLGLQARAAGRRAGPDPLERGRIGGVGAVLPGPGPDGGVLQRGVERRPRQVEPGAGYFRLQAGEQAQRLGVALEAAAGQGAGGGRERGERRLPVMPERRVAEVMRQARRVH